MPLSEEIELLVDVAGRLDEAGIAYMITGSMAMGLYATPRMTRDIDIVIRIAPHDARKVTALFENDFFVDSSSVFQAIRNKGMFNIIHNDTIIKVDFIVRKDEEYRIEEFERRQKVTIDNAEVWVAAPEDIILSKLTWAHSSGSELQFRDARQLLSAQNRLDTAYLEKWAQKLGVAPLLQKARTQ
jgi:hypothetical protein